MSRNNRWNKALESNFIKLDERSILDRVKFTLDYAKRINYYGLKNEVVGDWESFFLKDPIFIIAVISATNLQHFKSINDRIINQQSSGDSSVKIARLIENSIEMTQIIGQWQDLFAQSNYDGILKTELQNLSYSVKEDLISLKYGVAYSHNFAKQETDVKYFYASIVKQFGIKKSETAVDKETTLEDLEKGLIHSINEIFHHIYGKLVFLKEKANSEFDSELNRNHNHTPHVALLVTFFKLFQLVQSDLNTLTKKHLDFYYRKILGQNPTEETSVHKALVAIQLTPGVDKLDLEKDSGFNFEIEGEPESIFYSELASQINRAIITDIKSIYKSYHLPFDNKYTIGAFQINLIYEADILKNIQEKAEVPAKTYHDFPMILGEENDSKCELGFMISSPALILEKGHQDIKIHFKLDAKSYQTIDELFEILTDKELLLKKNASLTKEELKGTIVHKFFRQAFKLFITGEDGWNEVNYSQTKLDSDILSIHISLHALNDQLICYNPEIHSGNYDTAWPSVKLILNNEATYHPYIFLKDLALEYIRIKTTVSNVSQLQLSNVNGELDSSIPFEPFGSLPEKGSFLRIQNPKIFQKNLSAIELSINWNGLPQVRGGFKNYYEAYDAGIENKSFTATLGQSRELSREKGTTDQHEIALFDDDEFGYLKNEKSIPVDLKTVNFNDRIRLSDGEVKKNNGSLYLVFKRPEMGFGHQVFAEIYAETALKKSRFKKKNIPLPKSPYTPVIDRLTVNYTNLAKENVGRKQDDESTDIKFIHLYPFGQVLIFPGSIKSFCPLIPRIENKGNLFIGLKKVQSGDILSIGFDLIPAVYIHTIINVPAISWSYLSNDAWIDMKPYLLNDATSGLIKSGIVTFKIPSSIGMDNTRLPQGKFWIRAASHVIEEELNARVKNIFTQAVSLSSKTTFNSKLLHGNFKHKVLKITPIGNRKIQKVIGPHAMDINDLHDDEVSFYSRVSERLRHKNRGSSQWDIERLILNQFQNIEKVRVYGRNNFPKELVSGSTTQIVLIPKNNTVSETLTQGNKIDISTLRQVKNFVSQFISPYMKIEVCNPVYEQIKVRCRVKFTEVHKSQYLRSMLNEELIKYLSPDIDSHDTDKLFEESISRTEILNFIESRSYVDVVKTFSAIQLIEVAGKYKIIDTERTSPQRNVEELRTISAYAILTSAPQHHIEIIWPQSDNRSKIRGIDDIAIGSDFIIVDKDENYMDN